MLGLWSAGASHFLVASALASLLLLGLPMAVAPLAWARALGWTLPEHRHLAIYFGRCLGAVVCVLSAAALVAARHPEVQGFFFRILIGSFAAMVVVHAWGAVRRIQPLSETLETAAWLALLLLAVLFYPAGPGR